MSSRWKKEYLQRHTSSEIHKASIQVPILQKEAKDRIVYENMTADAAKALMTNVMFLCAEKLAILKTEKLHRFAFLF